MSLLTDTQRELYRAYSQSYGTEANRRVIGFVVDVVFAVAAVAVTMMAIRGLVEVRARHPCKLVTAGGTALADCPGD